MFDVSVSVQTIARSLQRVGVCKENGTSALYSLHYHVSHNINDSPRAPLILYTWLAMQKPPFHTTYCNRSAGSHSGLHYSRVAFSLSHSSPHYFPRSLFTFIYSSCIYSLQLKHNKLEKMFSQASNLASDLCRAPWGRFSVDSSAPHLRAPLGYSRATRLPTLWTSGRGLASRGGSRRLYSFTHPQAKIAILP